MTFNPYAEITAETIAAMQVAQTTEGRNLDYKQDLPRPKARREEGEDGRDDFLIDATAMANSAGGVLIYGIEEERDGDGKKTGRPGKVLGLDDAAIEDGTTPGPRW
jgi:predicted HTH transcriptional regulator